MKLKNYLIVFPKLFSLNSAKNRKQLIKAGQKRILNIKLRIYSLFSRLIPISKNWAEFLYWQYKNIEEYKLLNNHFKYYYCDHFNITENEYHEKKVLDLGCGPRGSLEWADRSRIRIGLDPLALKYRKLGTKHHNMIYVNANSEYIPFKSNTFDIVTSFNSLDHVDNIVRTVHEIKRLVKPNGIFLLLCEVNHPSFICEPQSFSWDIVKMFSPEFKELDVNHYLKMSGGIYQNIRKAVRCNHTICRKKTGIISAKFLRHSIK